jgi:WD40 repeat protein
MDLAYHPSGQLLALASGYNLQIFDLASGSQRLFTLPEMTQIRTIAFNQTGNWLAAGGGNGGDGSGGLIYAWRWDESGILRPDEQWLEQRVLSGHNHIVTSLAFMPNFGGLVSASHDGSVRLWNFVEGIEISRWQM